MTPQQAIALIEKNDLKAVYEAFGRADTQWHEKEWKEFIEAVRKDERERIIKEIYRVCYMNPAESPGYSRAAEVFYNPRDTWSEGYMQAEQDVKNELLQALTNNKE